MIVNTFKPRPKVTKILPISATDFSRAYVRFCHCLGRDAKWLSVTFTLIGIIVATARSASAQIPRLVDDKVKLEVTGATATFQIDTELCVNFPPSFLYGSMDLDVLVDFGDGQTAKHTVSHNIPKDPSATSPICADRKTIRITHTYLTGGTYLAKFQWQFPLRTSCTVGIMGDDCRSDSCLLPGCTLTFSPKTVAVNIQGAVEFVGLSRAAKFDSGFDGTNVETEPGVENTKGSLNRTAPAWISVAVGQRTTVVDAVITPPDNAKDVTFISRNTGIATVFVACPQTSPLTLCITGVSEGETEIDAMVGDNVIGSLKVASYFKDSHKANVVIVTLKGKNCAAPLVYSGLNGKTAAKTLQDGINKIWDQAAIEYTVGLRRKTIDADLDGNCSLGVLNASGGLSPELAKVHAVAGDSESNVNVYLAHAFDGAFNGISLRALVNGVSIVLVQGYPDQTEISTELVTAHEFGHDQGLSHCDDSQLSIDNTCAGEPNKSLMHSKISFTDFQGTLLHQPEWECAQVNTNCKRVPHL